MKSAFNYRANIPGLQALPEVTCRSAADVARVHKFFVVNQ